MNVSIFSFFSGSGFLDLGFEKSGYKVVEVNEFYKPFLNAYKFSRQKMQIQPPKYGYHAEDITTYLNSNSLRKKIINERKEGIVGFIGGPPCPDFSSAGKNKGSDGDNGKLTKTYFELIVKEKPDFFLFENVKGLLRTKKHKIFYDEMKNLLHMNGYILQDRLLNALQYGVPQDRERIFMVGFLKKSLKEDSSIVEELIENFGWGVNEDNLEKIKSYNWPEQTDYLVDDDLDMPNNIKPELTIEYWFKENDVYNHLNSVDYFKPRQALEKFNTILEGDISKKSFKRLHRWRYSPTAAYGNNEVHLHPYKSRRLSASEALAIQSLPKEFVLPETMTLTDKFKTIGNGVPYYMSHGIAKSLYKLISNIF
ncbi:DNA (cytosine-5)-methyltransferase 1 [Paenibacillus polymyxa]|uniref:DNA cytosine methyltransferase n=1 Tax=Paenibacillus polymyxa TaxID=1406 RepID=UPI0027944C78|nr:DNA cytosine methyltransferase [Paenibacillus polymyxa]MDQ0049466.1 DNA (cytosine-5)-methyltransferase 1 [Paenibacillus polymyxa]